MDPPSIDCQRGQTGAGLFSWILVLHTAMLAWGGYVHSPGLDEGSYLIGGVSHWHFGQFDQCKVSPPLLRTIAAIPVVLSNPRTDWRNHVVGVGARPEQQLASDFAAANGDQTFWFYAIARWALIPFSWLGALVCKRWADELYGGWSGLLAGTLWCFCPNILAAGMQVNPDLGMAALGVAAAYTFWKWLRQPSFLTVMIAGVVLGLSQLAKTNVVIFFPLWCWLWMADRLLSRPQWPTRPQLQKEMLQLGLMIAVAMYVLNLGYLFEGTGTRLKDFRFVSQTLAGDRPYGNRFAESWVGEIRVPFPKNYIAGIDLQRRDFENRDHNIQSYWRGRLYNHGFWWFYFYVLAIKVPLGTSALLLVALQSSWRRTDSRVTGRDEMLVVTPALALFLLASLQFGFSHHLRYVLGSFPFAFVWIGRIAAYRPRRLILVCFVGSIGSSLFAYPHSQSYFNEMVGGPRGGHFHVVDSNCDWGQDLLYLKRWIEKHPEARPLSVVYFGPVSPSLAGIDAAPLTARQPHDDPTARRHFRAAATTVEPPSVWIAISVEALRGGPFYGGPDYHQLLQFKPVGTVGYSIYIYNVSETAILPFARATGQGGLRQGNTALDIRSTGKRLMP